MCFPSDLIFAVTAIFSVFFAVTVVCSICFLKGRKKT